MCKIVQITSSIRLSELSACMKIETFMVLLRYPAHTDSSLLTLAPRSSAAGLEAKIQWVSRKSSEVYDILWSCSKSMLHESEQKSCEFSWNCRHHPPQNEKELWTARWKISKLGNGSMWRPGQNWTDIEIKTFPGAKTFRYENSMRLTIWWPPACWTTFQEALQPEECLLFSGDPLVQSSGTSYQRNEHVTCNTCCLFLHIFATAWTPDASHS